MFTISGEMKIKAVREKGGRVTLYFPDECEYTRLSISLPLYSSIGSPRAGSVLCEEDIEPLVREDTEWRVVNKALSILAASDKNKLALRRKLYDAGFSRDAVDMAVEYCVNLGYIDERRQLSILVSNEANRALRGRQYIKRKLLSKGYSSSDIDEVIDSLVEEGEIDFALNFDRLCEKKGAYDAESRKILAYKYGYRQSEV